MDFSIFSSIPLPLIFVNGEGVLLWRSASIEDSEKEYFPAGDMQGFLSLNVVSQGIHHCLSKREAIFLKSDLIANIDAEIRIFPVDNLGPDVCGLIWINQLSDELSQQSITESLRLIAHEIRNPLTGILGASQLIRRNFEGTKELFPYLERIEREITRLETLTHRLRNYSQELVSNSEFFDIHETLDEITFFLEKSTPSIKVTKTYDPSLTKVFFDKVAFHKLALNIMKNAIEACEKGRIEIQTSYELPWGIPEKLRKAGKKFLRLDISDYGHGVPAELKEKIFDHSFSTKTNGNGLGLYIGKKIAEELGGSLMLLNVAEPTTFRLHLPLVG